MARQVREYTVTEKELGRQIRVEVIPMRVDGTAGLSLDLFTKRVSSVCGYSRYVHCIRHAYVHLYMRVV